MISFLQIVGVLSLYLGTRLPLERKYYLEAASFLEWAGNPSTAGTARIKRKFVTNK